jgi:CDK-activating kinase assembly factor MAT1
MRFLINPECYHKMCESCVDRIFSAGPAPCPVAGCHKTLRKNRFRKQTFEDIHVEREVDIRRRIMSVLNRREDEFDSLRAYNDFLEQRESMIADLMAGADVARIEAQLAEYAAAHADSIKRNKRRETQETADIQQSQTREQEALRLRREAARREFDDERRAKLAGREGMISRLAAGTRQDAEAIAREAGALKKSSARRSEEERIKRKQASLLADKSAGSLGPAFSARPGAGKAGVTADAAFSANGGAGLIKGLKRVVTPEPEQPYDPFDGYSSLLQRDYFSLHESYPSTYLDPIRTDTRMLAGGYELKEYYARTLMEAFSGLGCFIGEERIKAVPGGGDGGIS